MAEMRVACTGLSSYANQHGASLHCVAAFSDDAIKQQLCMLLQRIHRRLAQCDELSIGHQSIAAVRQPVCELALP